LYLLARFTRRGQGFSFMRWVWIGAAFAVGVILQTSGLIMAIPIGAVLLFEAWRTRRWRVLVEGVAGVSIPIAVLGGWWFVRNQALYGDWTANSTIAALWTYGPVMPLDVALYLVGTGLVGRFGQGLMIDFPNPVYIAAGALTLLAVIGLVRAAVRHLRSVPVRQWLSPDFVLWALQPFTLIAVSISLTFYVLYYIHGVHGRYLFTAFPSIALLLAAGLLDWFRPRERALVAGVTLALTLGLALYGLFGLLIPTYAMPRSPSQVELRQMAPLDAEISDVAQVLGYQLSARVVKPGGYLDVTVYWQPQARTERPYTVFIHLFDPDLGSLAQRDTYPGSGNYATTVWDPGRTFVDRYRLRLPPDAATTDEARILLGLYDETTMQRLPVAGADAVADQSWIEFGDIRVQAANGE
jgi:hypothetical protein